MGSAPANDGASDPDHFEYDPAFSSDGKLIAFTRAPADGVDGPYRNRLGEVTIVPSTGGEPLTLAANVPASCAADDLSQGLLNASAVFAPSAPTSGGKTYYFVIFSSARSYGDEFSEPFQLPPDGSAPDGSRNSSQLYLATVVVDKDSGLMRRREARQSVADVTALESGLLAHFPGQKAPAQRAEGDETDA